MTPPPVPENRGARVKMMLRNRANSRTKKLNRSEGSRNLLGVGHNLKNATRKNKEIPFSLLYGPKPTQANKNSLRAAFSNPRTSKIKRNDINRMTRMVAYNLATLDV